MKNFFKPKIVKFVLVVLFVVSIFFIIGIGYECGWGSNSKEIFRCKYFLIPFSNIILAPSLLIGEMLDIRLNPIEKSANYIFSWVIQLVWFYTLASFIFSIGRSLLNKNIKSFFIILTTLVLLVATITILTPQLKEMRVNNNLRENGWVPEYRSKANCESNGYFWYPLINEEEGPFCRKEKIFGL